MTDQGQHNEIQRGRGTRAAPQDTAGSSEDVGFSLLNPTALLGNRARYPSQGEPEDAAFQ